MLQEIPVDLIDSSPYQHRSTFSPSKMQELANSIARDGLIQPITVRMPNGNGRYEMIAGERRWRAAKLAQLPTVLARVMDVNDLQARRMCAAENLQREDLSAVEEVRAIIEMVDAELIEDGDYQKFGDLPITRVRILLAGLKSGNETGNYVYSLGKFAQTVNIIFSNLPKPIKWESFYRHDLPLVTDIDADVAKFAAENKLNKSQTKETQRLKDEVPEIFEKIKDTTNEDKKSVLKVGLLDPETVEFSDLSAREIKKLRYEHSITGYDEHGHGQLVHFSSMTHEWYTPESILKKVITVLGEIDLDPCSNSKIHPNVPAKTHYTRGDDGLSRPWHGRVFMNPPYGDEIVNWINHLCEQWDSGNINEAIALVPSRTDTEWFRKLRNFPRCFVWGRLRFSEYDNSAPFPSMIVYLGDHLSEFATAFGDIGDIYPQATDYVCRGQEHRDT